MVEAPGFVFTTLHFLVTNEWAHKARVFFNGNSFQPRVMLHTYLFGPIIRLQSIVHTVHRV
jgi:hypothetical protein